MNSQASTQPEVTKPWSDAILCIKHRERVAACALPFLAQDWGVERDQVKLDTLLLYCHKQISIQPLDKFFPRALEFIGVKMPNDVLAKVMSTLFNYIRLYELTIHAIIDEVNELYPEITTWPCVPMKRFSLNSANVLASLEHGPLHDRIVSRIPDYRAQLKSASELIKSASCEEAAVPKFINYPFWQRQEEPANYWDKAAGLIHQIKLDHFSHEDPEVWLPECILPGAPRGPGKGPWKRERTAQFPVKRMMLEGRDDGCPAPFAPFSYPESLSDEATLGDIFPNMRVVVFEEGSAKKEFECLAERSVKVKDALKAGDKARQELTNEWATRNLDDKHEPKGVSARTSMEVHNRRLNIMYEGEYDGVTYNSADVMESDAPEATKAAVRTTMPITIDWKAHAVWLENQVPALAVVPRGKWDVEGLGQYPAPSRARLEAISKMLKTADPDLQIPEDPDDAARVRKFHVVYRDGLIVVENWGYAGSEEGDVVLLDDFEPTHPLDGAVRPMMSASCRPFVCYSGGLYSQDLTAKDIEFSAYLVTMIGDNMWRMSSLPGGNGRGGACNWKRAALNSGH